MCNNDKQPLTARILRVFLSSAVVILFAACIVIPVDYYDVGVRRNVSEKTCAKLQTGKTTRHDVFLLLGEPDYASEDGQRIGYAWTKVKALIIVASYSGAGGAEIQRSYILEVSFANDLVCGARIIKDWGSQVTPAHELQKQNPDRQ